MILGLCIFFSLKKICMNQIGMSKVISDIKSGLSKYFRTFLKLCMSENHTTEIRSQGPDVYFFVSYFFFELQLSSGPKCEYCVLP